VPEEAALDTTVLRRANVELKENRAAAVRMSSRLALLRRICKKEIVVLISERLAHEYMVQLRDVQNEVVKAFLELATKPDGNHVVFNWKSQWSGSDRDRARLCRYPKEDEHVLRTAIRDGPTVIYTEEGRMLRTDACIYGAFRVHIQEP
jgi:hypothetical protein